MEMGGERRETEKERDSDMTEEREEDERSDITRNIASHVFVCLPVVFSRD